MAKVSSMHPTTVWLRADMQKRAESDISMWRQAVRTPSDRPAHETIAVRAYLKHLQHPGLDCALSDWIDAEKELIYESLVHRR